MLTPTHRVRLDPRSCRFTLFLFFFSFLACVSGGLRLLFNVDFSTVNSVFMYCMYCSRIHKYHFLTIFSLKIGSMVLFTHLKFILLQCFQFSVFSFSKISYIQTDP